MKKLSFIIVAAALLSVMASCKNNYGHTADSNEKIAANNDSANFTQVQWLDTAKDLGTITEGQKVEVSFRFKNSGDKPLVIERVQPSCGCTVAETPKEPVSPGSEGVIKGVFDSNGKVGPNHKTMYVYANTRPTEHVLVFNVVVNKKQ